MNLDAIERGIAIAEYMQRETERIVAMFSDYESKDSMTAIIKTIIRKHAGEATIQNFRDGCSMFHAKGGTERLKDKLNEMVNAGILTVREEKAGNGKVVAYYSERNS